MNQFGEFEQGQGFRFEPVTDPARQCELKTGDRLDDHSFLIHLAHTNGAWRRLRVPGNIGMERLARLVQVAFDLTDPAEHVFLQQGPDDSLKPAAIMPAPTLVRFDAAGTPSETVTLGEVLLPGMSLDYLSRFDDPIRIHISMVTDSERLPNLETLCVDGKGSAGDYPFDLESINREIDAERWVYAKVSATKPSLRDLIFRTGMWETAQLIAFLDIEWPAMVTDEDAEIMVSPILASLRDGSNRELLTALGLLDPLKGELSFVGHKLIDDPLALWKHIAWRLPLERDAKSNDAAWLLLISLVASMPYGAATTFILEGMVWAGHTRRDAPSLTLAEIDSMTRLTTETLKVLGILDGGTLVLGGPLSKARREFLRMILRDQKFQS